MTAVPPALDSSKDVYGHVQYGKAGKTKEAKKILKDFLDRSKRSYYSPFSIAIIYSGLGEKDKVFEWLDRAYEVQDPVQTMITIFPYFTDLHSDPRWTEHMKKMGLAD